MSSKNPFKGAVVELSVNAEPVMLSPFATWIVTEASQERPQEPKAREAELERENKQLERDVASLRNFINGLNDQPCSYVSVIGKGASPNKWLVRRGAETLEVNGPPNKAIKPGQTVRVLTQTLNILDVVEAAPAGGELVSVVEVVDSDTCTVAYGPGTRAILTAGHAVIAGDRVILDASGVVIVRNLGPEKSAQAITHETGVTWDDIGGQVEAKAAMREAIEGPVVNKAVYERYGRRPTKGVLMYGPPGNGKTMLGKAAATALAKLHGASAGQSGFLYVKGPELLSMYVGAAEQGVRQLFESARRHKREHGYPAVIFIDEAEALLGRRGGSGLVAANYMAQTIVPVFLAEMDGLVDSGAFVLLATNRPDVLDPAVVREGRIDRKVLVGRPGREDAAQIFARYFSGKPLSEGTDIDAIVQAAVSSLYNSSHALYRVRLASVSPKAVTLGHLTSGAQIAALVDLAASSAIDRELAGGAPGICALDVEAAVVKTLKEQRALSHVDELALFCEPFKNDVVDVERVTPGETKSKPGPVSVISLATTLAAASSGSN